MESKILFSEKQKFRQWWLWLLILGVNGTTVFSLFYVAMKKQQIGNHPVNDTSLFISAGVIMLLTILFLAFRLETIIKEKGIYVRFFPFHVKFRYYAWEILTKSYVRTYSPLGEYGGWGIRIGFSGAGKAFNVCGNQGLQLEFENKKKLLVGTNKPEEISALLNEIGQVKV